jgi:hypothetical protein
VTRWQYYTNVEAHLEPMFNGYALNDVPVSSAFRISAGRHARSGKIANSLGNENHHSNVGKATEIPKPAAGLGSEESPESEQQGRHQRKRHTLRQQLTKYT